MDRISLAMNGSRLSTHLPGLLFLIVAIAGCSQGRQLDTAANSLSLGRSVLGVFQDWEAEVLRLDGVSVCHARTTSTSHLVGGQPWSAPAELRVTEDRFDLKVVDVGREDGWGVVGADDLRGSELAGYLKTLEADQNGAVVAVLFRLDPESDDSDVGTARFSLRGFSEAHAASKAHCADERASRPQPTSPAPIRSLAESGITEEYRWGSLGPDPHVELELTSPLFRMRGAEDTVVIKARMHRWWTDDELWISQEELEEWQEEWEVRYGELNGEFDEQAHLAIVFSRGLSFINGLPDLGFIDLYEVYRNDQRMGELPHPGTTSDLAGVCSDPVSGDLRFFRVGWSGGASDPAVLSMFYFTENDAVREEALWNFDGAGLSTSFVDCSSTEVNPGPCLCKGPAANQRTEFEAIVDEIWEPLRGSLEWTTISEEVMRRQVLEPIHTYSGFRNAFAIAPHAEVAINAEFAVLFLSYGSDWLVWGGARAVLARRLSDTSWTLLRHQAGNAINGLVDSSGGFVDSDRIRINRPGWDRVVSDTINVRELLDQPRR